MKRSRPACPTCTAIVCAYDEEQHMEAVLNGLLEAPFIQEIIVVDDGSKDRTPDILYQYRQIDKVRPIFLPSNHGKGYAMAEATAAASGDILLFVDADLINWNADYAGQVLSPILEGRADMVIGYPLRANDKWDAVDVLGLQRWISGERAVWRTDLLPILAKMRPSRFGAETLINMHYRTRHQPIRMVKLDGLLHPIKFEKSPRSEAWDEYVKEGHQILETYARHPLLTIMTYVPDLMTCEMHCLRSTVGCVRQFPWPPCSDKFRYLMKTNSTIIQDSQSANEYDNQARKTNWFGPEVVFGLTYEFMKPGDTMLDLGIGSGLSSILFHKAGLQIFGLDGSSEILKVCESKGFAMGLKQHDLRDLPLPYPSRFCNHMISIAVLNSFEDLGPLFKEIARIILVNGIFAFTVEEQKPGQEDRYAINRVEVSEKPKEETAVMLFRHSEEYITQLLDQNKFVLLKALEFVAFKYPAENRDVFFKAYIARKRE